MGFQRNQAVQALRATVSMWDCVWILPLLLEEVAYIFVNSNW
jgi:hypothetical protein